MSQVEAAASSVGTKRSTTEISSRGTKGAPNMLNYFNIWLQQEELTLSNVGLDVATSQEGVVRYKKPSLLFLE